MPSLLINFRNSFSFPSTAESLIDEEKNSYILQGSSGCVKTDNTFYTLFDITDHYGNDDNFKIYRVDVKYNRKKFVAKMMAADLPGKEVYAPFCFASILCCFIHVKMYDGI